MVLERDTWAYIYIYEAFCLISDEFKKRGKCVCPEPCESIEYMPTLSYAYFPSDAYAEEVAKHLVNTKTASTIDAAKVYMR